MDLTGHGYGIAVSDSYEHAPDPPEPVDRVKAPEQATVYRGTGISVALIIGVLLAVVTIIFAFQNTEDTTVEVFAGDFRAPLVVVILAAAIAGVVLDEIFGLFWRHRRRRRLADRAELRRLRRER